MKKKKSGLAGRGQFHSSNIRQEGDHKGDEGSNATKLQNNYRHDSGPAANQDGPGNKNLKANYGSQASWTNAYLSSGGSDNTRNDQGRSGECTNQA